MLPLPQPARLGANTAVVGQTQLRWELERAHASNIVLERALRRVPDGGGDVRLELAECQEVCVRLGCELAELHDERDALHRALDDERASSARATHHVQLLECRVAELEARGRDDAQRARDSAAARERASSASVQAQADAAHEAREQRDATLDRLIEMQAEIAALRAAERRTRGDGALELQLQLERGELLERSAAEREAALAAERACVEALETSVRALTMELEHERVAQSEVHAHALALEAQLRSALARGDLADAALVGVVDAAERERREVYDALAQSGALGMRTTTAAIQPHVIADQLAAALDDLSARAELRDEQPRARRSTGWAAAAARPDDVSPRRGGASSAPRPAPRAAATGASAPHGQSERLQALAASREQLRDELARLSTARQRAASCAGTLPSHTAQRSPGRSDASERDSPSRRGSDPSSPTSGLGIDGARYAAALDLLTAAAGALSANDDDDSSGDSS
jgi:hypothetical protein